MFEIFVESLGAINSVYAAELDDRHIAYRFDPDARYTRIMTKAEFKKAHRLAEGASELNYGTAASLSDLGVD